jgi:membrane associated rhomboid family serine protease
MLPPREDPAGPVSRFVPIAGFIAVIWVAEFVDQLIGGGRLDRHGILPRSLEGLDGILWAPLLHGGIGHLMSNTLPLAVLGGLIALRGAKRWATVTAFIALVAGLATWVLARPSIHIGASMLVFGYITYLVTAGFFERRIGGVILGVAVLVFYGGTLLWGVLPIHQGVSWEGHLFGAVAGVGAARVGVGNRTGPT